MRRQYLLVAVVAVLLACTVAYYAPYDPIMETDVEELRLQTATYLASVREVVLAGELSSDVDASFYQEAAGKIDALILRAEYTPRNDETAKMLNLLKSTLQNIAYLQAADMNVTQIDMVMSAIDGQFYAIIDLEQSKKGGPHGRD